MSNYTIKQIAKLDSRSLTSVIDYWRDHSTETVLLAYGEIRRRNILIPNGLKTRQDEFCKQNGRENMDDYLIDFLKQNPTYNDYFDGQIVFQLSKTAAQGTSEHNQTKEDSTSGNRYPVLKTIADLYMALAYLVGLVTLGLFFYRLLYLYEYDASIAFIVLIAGLIVTLALAATSEGIKVLLDIEYNTRKASMKQRK